jgi:hypothetical protein
LLKKYRPAIIFIRFDEVSFRYTTQLISEAQEVCSLMVDFVNKHNQKETEI